jgi:hypothetical protein
VCERVYPGVDGGFGVSAQHKIACLAENVYVISYMSLKFSKLRDAVNACPCSGSVVSVV